MKMNELKNLYGKPSENFHNSVLNSLYMLDDKKRGKNKYRGRVIKIAAVCAAAIVIGSFTAAAANTHFFGLFSEKVGNYGLKLGVESTPDEAAEAPRYIRVKPNWLPKGVIETPHTEGIKYSLDGEALEKNITFFAEKSRGFNITWDYIVSSRETAIAGKKAVIATCRFDENSSEESYMALVYYDGLGIVTGCWGSHGITEKEIIKVMENLSVEKGDKKNHFGGYDGNASEEAVNSYKFFDGSYEYVTEKNEKAFGYSEYDYDAEGNKLADGAHWDITVNKAEKIENVSDLEYNYFEQNGFEGNVYDDYFTADGSLKTPYDRREVTKGDGISSLNKTGYSKTERSFYVFDVTIKNNKPESIQFPSEFDSFKLQPVLLNKNVSGFSDYEGFGTAEMIYFDHTSYNNVVKIQCGESKTVKVGFVIDNEVADNAYLRFETETAEQYAEGETLHNSVVAHVVKLIG